MNNSFCWQLTNHFYSCESAWVCLRFPQSDDSINSHKALSDQELSCLPTETAKGGTWQAGDPIVPPSASPCQSVAFRSHLVPCTPRVTGCKRVKPRSQVLCRALQAVLLEQFRPVLLCHFRKVRMVCRMSYKIIAVSLSQARSHTRQKSGKATCLDLPRFS